MILFSLPIRSNIKFEVIIFTFSLLVVDVVSPSKNNILGNEDGATGSSLSFSIEEGKGTY